MQHSLTNMTEKKSTATIPLNDKFVGKYVGPDEVVAISLIELTTASGHGVFELVYKSGNTAIYPEKGLMAVISKEPKDLNHLRDARVNLMVPEILNVIKEYDIPLEQFTWLMQQTMMQWQNHFNRANAILWYGDDRSYVPGVDTMEMLTLLQAERINQKEDNKK